MNKLKPVIFAAFVAFLLLSCNTQHGPSKLVNVTSISIPSNKSDILLTVGKTYQLEAKVKPDNATDKRLTYTSSAAGVVSVSDTGLITAKSAGSAKITITAANGISKEINVVVTTEDVAVTDIIVETAEDPLSIVKGGTHKLTAKVSPDTATKKQLTYTSSDNNIVSVTADGLVTAKETGTAKITITAENGISKTINVTVTSAHISVASIEFTAPLPVQPIELFVGDEYTLQAKAMPENATNKKLNFTTSDASIAGLSGEENNVVKANGEGEATITITSDDNHSITQEVRFKMKIRPVPSIRIKQQPEKCKNNACKATFVIEKINGGLEYKPVIVGGGSKWMEISDEVTSSGAEDTIQLNVSENKTIWERTAYIKFKNSANKFIKGKDDKELEVKLIQDKNENPNVRIEWVHGITPPIDNEKKKVEIQGSNPTEYHTMPYVFYWYETEHTKFFNTRKMSPTGSADQGFPDGSQCWAKSSSNMLHWWFEQNKENVKKYIAKKGITKENNLATYEMYNPVYTRGLPDTDENIKSSIANEFRKKCPNSTNGNWIYSGLRWYLYGLKGLAKDKTYSPALFKDVFGKGEENDPVVAEGTYTKKIFEDILKDALLNPNSKKAVGVHVHDEGKYGHGITLWGAAFDEEENVIAIYVCDNNFKPNRIFTYGIYYKSDIYADDPEGETNVYPYLINYAINKKINRYVGTLVTLDKGDAQWKKWLDANQ